LRRFAADAAHELRTPLTVLRGHLEVALRADRSPEEYRRALATSLGEVERLTRLAEDLLLLSRATAGLPGRREPVELAPLLSEVAADTARLAERRGVSVEVAPPTPLAVLGDAGALRRAAMNIAENAVRYTGAGGRVTLSLRRDDGAAALTVADTGPGIDPADAERIFQPFVRLEAGRATNPDGSGLGLPIARSIALAHGGTLELQSAPGAGARFTLRLPLAE
ncbi:MAG TPA: ATP-binding protein, partial [Candidatus Tectomicrobia bacterium]|nr:ATP-binding protein [Candidatus Tectomicrobia bacterium]